ncbi:MAG: hypothetical protein DKT66_21300 [Candidatus Melainabacteria bacterium]|nr:MAG: hypothetical protein DKT66_21300 [Candidatus Melainabacteria bacterium]
MSKKSLRKKLSRVTVFSKVGLAMAGSILLQSAPANAGNNDFPGGRGAAFREFKQANDGLSGKQINQLFKVHWADMRNSVQAVAQPIFEQNANNLSHGSNAINANVNLQNLSNPVGSTKQELNQQFKLERQAQKIQQQTLKQELKEAKQNFNTVQQISADRFIRGNGGFSLDLSSAVENITLGDKLFQNESSITISIGGESKTLSAGSKVTAAEYIAAKQVLATGGQKVGLDARGRAVSGSIDLNELTPGDKTMKVRDFVVPENVSAAGDFSKNGDIRITGDLINSGTIQAFSSDNKITSATISADNITNNSNASISSELNQSARDLGGVVSNLGLNLRADDVLSNYGSITSSGDLTLSAGKTLTNSGNAIAHNNLNLQAPKIVNSGRIESIAANVNLDSSSLSALIVNNYGGTITASDGAINIRSSEFQDRFDTLVSGGDLLSKELNVFTGGGTSNVFVNELSGVVNTSGSAAHVKADTSTLVIGKQCLIGDPTYYNTGDIVIDGDIVVGEALAIISGGNITATSNLSEITARDNNGQGYSIYILAGVRFVSGTGELQPGGGPATLPSQSPGVYTGNATGNVTVSLSSAPGGDIDFSNASPTLTINSNSTSGNLNGAITAIVAANSGTTGGHVILPSLSTINAGGSGNGTNGNVHVGAANSIQIGNIYSDSGQSPGGLIRVVSGNPSSSNGADLVFDPTGQMISNTGGFGAGSFAGSVATGNIHSTGLIQILSGKSLTAGDLITDQGISVGNTYSGNTLGLTVGNVTARGGSLSLFTNGALTTQNIEAVSFSIDTDGAIVTGNINTTGDISLVNVFSNVTPGVSTGNLVSSSGKITIQTKGSVAVGDVTAFGNVSLQAQYGSSGSFQGGDVSSQNGNVGISCKTQLIVGDIDAYGSIGADSQTSGLVSAGNLYSTTGAIGLYGHGALTAGGVEAATFVTLSNFHGPSLNALNITAHSGYVTVGSGGDLNVGEISAGSEVSLGGGTNAIISVGNVSSGGYFKASGTGASLTIGNVEAVNYVDCIGLGSISMGSIQTPSSSYVLIQATNSVSVGGINAPSGPITVASNGTMYLGGSIYTGGHALNLIANSAIDSAQGIEISTENQNGAGGIVRILAGANFQLDTGNRLVRITSGLPFGGNVNLGGVTKFVTNGTTDGGDVLIVAWGGPSAGNVDLSGVPEITTGGGQPLLHEGNFKVIAGGRVDDAINIQSIRTRSLASSGAIGTGGDVLLSVSDPTISGVGNQFLLNYETGAQFGSVTTSNLSLANGDIRVGSIRSSGNIDIQTRDTLNFRPSSEIISFAPNNPDAYLSIYAGNINMLGSARFICTDGATTGGSISIRAWQGNVNGTDLQFTSGKSVFISGQIINTSQFTVSSQGTVTVSTNLLSASANSGSLGGTVSITGKGDMWIGDIAAEGGEISNGGSIAVKNLSNSAEDSLSLGSLTARGGATSGSGGTIAVSTSGPGGISFRADSLVSTSATTGSAGDVAIISGSGPLANFGKISFLGNQTISATGGAGFTNGGITLHSASVEIGGDLTIDTFGLGSLAGIKNVSLTVYSGSLQTHGHDLVISSRNNLNASWLHYISTVDSNVDSGDLTIKVGNEFTSQGFDGIDTYSNKDASNGGDVLIQIFKTVSGGFSRITTDGKTSGNGGNVTLVGDVGFGRISANGGTSGNGGTIQVNLNTSRSSIPDLLSSVGIVNGDITYTNSGSGYISPYAVIGRNIVLSAQNIFSSFTVPTVITGTGSVQLNAVQRITMSGVITTPILTVSGEANRDTGLGIRFTNGASSVTLNYSGRDGLFESVGAGQVNLGNISGGFFELTSSSDVVTTSDVTLTNGLKLIVSKLVNEHTLNGGSSLIIESNGSGLILDGGAGGTLRADHGPINIVANEGNLTLEGKTTYSTTANLLAQGAGQQIVLGAGSDSIAAVTSFLYTSTLAGSGTLTTFNVPDATWIFLQGGTLLNKPGDIFLLGNINISGADFAILASGNINLQGTIDLSGSTNGGSLTMIAGYGFSYDTAGAVTFDKTTTINNFMPSATPGSINASGVTIITAGGTGNGGNVVAIATGSITLGDITATGGATSSGGTVTVIAKDGISLGAINTTGGLASGGVTLAVANANIPSGTNFQILNGNIISNSAPITAGSITNGSLEVQTITSPDASVVLIGAHRYDDRISTNFVTADSLTLYTDNGSAIVQGSLNLFNSIATGTSRVVSGNDKNLTIGTIEGILQTLSLSVTNGGILTNTGSFTVNNLSLASDNFDMSNGTITTSNANIYSSAGFSNLGNLNAQLINLVQEGTITSLNLASTTLNTPTINLTSSTGDIGSSTNRLLLPTLNGKLYLYAQNGSVFVKSDVNSPGGFDLYGGASRGDFDYLGTGITNIVGSIDTTDGDINIATAVSKINLASGVQLNAHGTTAGNGNITIRVLDTSKAAKKTSVINLSSGSQLNTVATGTEGVITLSVGEVTAPVLGKAPKKNVQIINQGGTIFWGKKTAAFNLPTNVLHTKGTNIVFNNAYGNKNIIVSGSTLFADPPVADGTPLTVITTPSDQKADSMQHVANGLDSNLFAQNIHGNFHAPASQYFKTGSDIGFINKSVLLANSNLSLLTEIDEEARTKEVRQLAFSSSYDSSDNSYMVGSNGYSGDFIAGICTDAEIGFAGDGAIQRIKHSEQVKLTDGSILFAPLHDTQVQTPKGAVRVAANAIALISVSEAGLSVFDLDDQHKGSVSVESNGHNVVLSPGRHVMITPHHKAEFAQLNPIETIAHRALSSNVKNGHRAHMSEFSVLSAIDSVKPLKALACSSHPNARKIAGRMMKTTAILMQLGGSSGEQYQHYFRPRMTAMQK